MSRKKAGSRGCLIKPFTCPVNKKAAGCTEPGWGGNLKRESNQPSADLDLIS